ncbi:PIG-L family deacetylase [Stigmatella sp. ncwal1]|uniref:PIG-L family deacetylase n=1 Tax=Stigmatella ashevillensis TaxID=2995309 RepID=A0ABT5DMR9_9BACT|nr:PIG-L family deacetylase [Stigmatella ashevillena]MDC0714956.1 PIG-L family deacetylase [Stigmatella ashevillena]
MKTALFLSPHLDDVAFSCGGMLARLKARRWRIVLATVFTRSVAHPTGFALACQTDKGLGPDVDYMALRRAEDRSFAAWMGVDQLVWMDLPEAPHRGYHSPGALFAPPRRDDDIIPTLEEKLSLLIDEVRPDLVLAPQALGSHVDHVQLVRVLPSLNVQVSQVLWYRDTPYAVRQPSAKPDLSLPDGLRPLAVNVTAELPRKVAGCVCYRSQLPFQFGGEEAVAPLLESFHQLEAEAHGQPGHAEVFLAGSTLEPEWRGLL